VSWEECGFKPGAIHGPDKCARTCSDCDGDHHFYAHSVDPEDDERNDECGRAEQEAIAAGHTEFFVCKHCVTWAEMVDEDEELAP